jgi:hypothetical protein
MMPLACQSSIDFLIRFGSQQNSAAKSATVEGPILSMTLIASRNVILMLVFLLIAVGIGCGFGGFECLVDFLTMHLHVLWSFHAESDFILTDSSDHDCDLVTDANPLFNFAT